MSSWAELLQQSDPSYRNYTSGSSTNSRFLLPAEEDDDDDDDNGGEESNENEYHNTDDKNEDTKPNVTISSAETSEDDDDDEVPGSFRRPIFVVEDNLQQEQEGQGQGDSFKSQHEVVLLSSPKGTVDCDNNLVEPTRDCQTGERQHQQEQQQQEQQQQEQQHESAGALGTVPQTPPPQCRADVGPSSSERKRRTSATNRPYSSPDSAAPAAAAANPSVLVRTKRNAQQQYESTTTVTPSPNVLRSSTPIQTTTTTTTTTTFNTTNTNTNTTTTTVTAAVHPSSPASATTTTEATTSELQSFPELKKQANQNKAIMYLQPPTQQPVSPGAVQEGVVLAAAAAAAAARSTTAATSSEDEDVLALYNSSSGQDDRFDVSSRIIVDSPQLWEEMGSVVAHLDNQGNQLAEAGWHEHAIECYERALALKRKALRSTQHSKQQLKKKAAAQQQQQQNSPKNDGSNNKDKQPSNEDEEENRFNRTPAEEVFDLKGDESRLQEWSQLKQLQFSILVSIATSLNNIAYVQQRYLKTATSKMMKSYKKALQIKRHILGPYHLSVGNILNNIGAGAYLRQDFRAALVHYGEALRILRARVEDPDHNLDVATVLANIGDVYCAMGREGEALTLYEAALQIRVPLLDADDLRVTRLQNLMGRIQTHPHVNQIVARNNRKKKKSSKKKHAKHNKDRATTTTTSPQHQDGMNDDSDNFNPTGRLELQDVVADTASMQAISLITGTFGTTTETWTFPGTPLGEGRRRELETVREADNAVDELYDQLSAGKTTSYRSGNPNSEEGSRGQEGRETTREVFFTPEESMELLNRKAARDGDSSNLTNLVRNLADGLNVTAEQQQQQQQGKPWGSGAGMDSSGAKVSVGSTRNKGQGVKSGERGALSGKSSAEMENRDLIVDTGDALLNEILGDSMPGEEGVDLAYRREKTDTSGGDVGVRKTPNAGSGSTSSAPRPNRSGGSKQNSSEANAERGNQFVRDDKDKDKNNNSRIAGPPRPARIKVDTDVWQYTSPSRQHPQGGQLIQRSMDATWLSPSTYGHSQDARRAGDISRGLPYSPGTPRSPERKTVVGKNHLRETGRIVVVAEIAGYTASEGVKTFLKVFLPLAQISSDARYARELEWIIADISGNGILSFNMFERWIFRRLTAFVGLSGGSELFKASSPAYARAFHDALDVPGLDNQGFIGRPTFRLLVAHLCIYALAFDAFDIVDSLTASARTEDDAHDKRVTLREWKFGFRRILNHGFLALYNCLNVDDMEEYSLSIFRDMDDNRSGMVMLKGWCHYLKRTELEAGTTIGCLLSISEDVGTPQRGGRLNSVPESSS